MLLMWLHVGMKVSTTTDNMNNHEVKRNIIIFIYIKI